MNSGIYSSNERVILQKTSGGAVCQINPTIIVTASAAYEIIFRPGTVIKAGGKFTGRALDQDGLSNRFEMQYFGNLNQDPSDDPDHDQLTNLQEYGLGTDPTSGDADNDNDTLPDWWEVRYFGLTLSHGPNDQSDTDGVSNGIEYNLGSNPAADDLPGPGIHYEYDELGRITKIFRIPAR